MRIVWSLALAQLRHHRGRFALLALGIALVVAVPVVTAAMSASVSAQTVRRTIAKLDLADRTLVVNQEPTSAFRKGTPDQNDRAVRAQLARLTSTPPLRELLFRKLTVAGASFYLGAADHLPGAVRLLGGRLPHSCTPTRCEVVVLGGHDSARLRNAVSQLGAVVVGRTDRRSPLLVSGAFDPGGLPVVLGANVDAMARLKALELFGRTYAWVAPVDPDRVIALGAPGYVAVSADVDAFLGRHVGGTAFVRPDAALLAAQDRADSSTRRFGLLGGFAAVLLLGFAVVAAIGLRRETKLLASVLVRRGASTGQVVATTVVEVIVSAAAGVLAGAVIGGVVAAATAGGTSRGAVAAALHAIATSGLSAGLLTLAAAVVAVAVLLWADAQARGVWRVLDLVALACLGTALLATDRGSVTAGSDPVVVALPVLASVVAGLVAARLWGPLASLAAKLLPRRSVAARIGLLGAIRRPLRPVATVAFLTAATASVVFAGAYRATLLANNADQAAYQVPLDATITGSETELVPSLPPNAFGRDADVYAVRRTSAGITRQVGVVESTPVVAADAAALPHMRDWSRTTGSSLAAAELARRLQLRTPAAPRLPAGTHTLAIAVDGYNPDSAVDIWLRTSTGHELPVPLSHRGDRLVAAVPAGALTVVALGVDQSYSYATRRAHALGEGNTDLPPLSGTTRFGTVYADGRPVPWSWASWGSAHGRTATGAGRLALTYRITGGPVVAAPSYAAVSAAPIPVAVDATTARDVHGGVLQLAIDATTTLTARVVAVLPRLPTVSGPFILADRATYSAALDLYEPGGNPTEYWVAAPTAVLDHQLATSRFGYLSVVRRDQLQRDLDSDPIGRGARDLLVIVALLALAVAAVALILLVIGERRDGAGELYAWEADGTRPATLRRMLAIRMLAVAVIAIPIGVVAGLLVAHAGTTLVAVDASGTTPTPPLSVTLGSIWTPFALLIGVGAGVLLGAVVAAAALRERFPVAAEADLR